MSRLDLYVLRQILLAFGFALGAGVVVVLFAQSFRLLALVIDNAAGVGIFVRLALLTIPTFLGYVLPIALAAAIIFTYHKLNGDSELVIMRSAGMSAAALARPALLSAIAATFIALAVALWIAPWANRTLVEMQYKIRSEFSVLLLRPGLFNEVTEDVTFYARRRDGKGGLEGILLHDSRNTSRPITLMAERGVITIVDGEPRIVVYNGQRQEYERVTGHLTTLDFARYVSDISMLRGGGDRLPDPRELSPGQLLSDNPPPVKNHAPRARLIAELNQRVGNALSTLGFAALAAALMLTGGYSRRGMAARIGVAILALILLEVILLSASSMTARDLIYTPLLYIAALGPLAAALWLLARNPLDPPILGRIMGEAAS